MSFAQPLFLWGLLAALIPLLVHLFDRRRPRVVPFAALEFVLRSQRRTASRLRLKRLLLYLLRTLLLLAVPLALARPACTSNEITPSARGLAATAIVVDGSLAMRWAQGSPLIDEARVQSRAAIGELKPEEPAALVWCGPRPEMLAPLSFDRGRLLSALAQGQVSYETVDLQRCLEMGARALDDSPLPNRRLVLVSALTQNSLSLGAPLAQGANARGEPIKPELIVRDVAPGAVLTNRALVDVRAEAAPQLGLRAWQFVFTVRNFGQEAISNLELRLEVAGEVVQKGFVDLGAHGTAQKTLSWRFPEGGDMTVTGRLAGDALPEDDSLSIMVSVPKGLKALLVNGSPSAQKYRDEAFFTEAALSAPGSPVRAVVRDADAAWKEELSGYRAILLLNVDAPPPEAAAALAQFVAAGGGLFISMGDRVDPEAWNASMGRVLPRPLRVVKTAVEPGQPDVSSRAARLTQISVAHPIMAPFMGVAREGLLSTRFYRYTLFESEGTAGPSEILATLDDGAPAFLAMHRGKGRVFISASTVDRDWSDLPIRTSFLPLMQRLVGWLTGSLDESHAVRTRVGGQVELRDERDEAGRAGPARAMAPTGRQVALSQSPTDAHAVTGGPIPEPGPYQVVDAQGQVISSLGFVACIEPVASDLTRHSLEALSEWAGADTLHTPTAGMSPTLAPLWSWLLAVAALAFFLEGLIVAWK